MDAELWLMIKEEWLGRSSDFIEVLPINSFWEISLSDLEIFVLGKAIHAIIISLDSFIPLVYRWSEMIELNIYRIMKFLKIN